jgi:hypothetical protein
MFILGLRLGRFLFRRVKPGEQESIIIRNNESLLNAAFSSEDRCDGIQVGIFLPLKNTTVYL